MPRAVATLDPDAGWVPDGGVTDHEIFPWRAPLFKAIARDVVSWPSLPPGIVFGADCLVLAQGLDLPGRGRPGLPRSMPRRRAMCRARFFALNALSQRPGSHGHGMAPATTLTSSIPRNVKRSGSCSRSRRTSGRADTVHLESGGCRVNAAVADRWRAAAPPDRAGTAPMVGECPTPGPMTRCRYARRQRTALRPDLRLGAVPYLVFRPKSRARQPHHLAKRCRSSARTT